MPQSNGPVIQASNLTKYYGKIPAVDHLDFAVKKAEVFGFLGPNGAGKTTTIRMLTGILKPDHGSVTIAGINFLKQPLRAKMLMGVIPETGNVYADLTAEQNLHLAGKYYGLPKNDLVIRSNEILSQFGLEERADHLVRTFSKGLKQRINIGCAIIHNPSILFLDEPTEGLDLLSRRLIIETIHRMNENGTTVFLTTHNIEEANRLCQRIAIINKGKIVAIDRPEVLRSTFDKTRSIEVAFDRRTDKELLYCDSILKIDLHGDKWRLYTNDPDTTVKHVAALAEKHDLKIIALTICGPSLEDAFIRLTGGK